MTSIEWTRGDDGSEGKTWNPLRGCSKVSAGCRNCYAEKQAARFAHGPSLGPDDGSVEPPPVGPYHGLVRGGHWTGVVRFVPELLDAPLRWRKPRRVFVNSMSDLFHESVPTEVLDKIVAVIGMAGALRGHTMQVLTKRADRMLAYLSDSELPARLRRAAYLLGDGSRPARQGWLRVDDWHPERWPWAWWGVSAEDQSAADERIPLLLRCPAALRFVSAEPLLGPIKLDADWLYPRCAHCGRHSQRDCWRCGWSDCGGPIETGGWDGLLDWVIIGGESGPGARPCDVAWVRSLVRQCREAGTACFVKQLGASPVPEARDVAHGFMVTHRKGGDPSEWPADLRVREWPRTA